MPSKTPSPTVPPKRTRAGIADFLHPFCFAVFPLLALYVANIHSVLWRDAARPLIIGAVASLLLSVAIGVLARNVRRATIFVSAFFFLFFMDGHIRDFFASYRPGLSGPPSAVSRLLVTLATFFSSDPVRAHFVTCGVLLLPLILIGVVIFRTKRDLAPLSSLLNVVGLVLIAPPAFAIAVAAIHHNGFSGGYWGDDDPIGQSAANLRAHPDRIGPVPTTQFPDIYYIILDAYGREDVLRTFYHFDNSPFTRALQQRGFYVAPRARPNYGRTIMSISSSLNMEYLDSVTQRMDPTDSDTTPLRKLIDEPAVAQFLHPRGYRYVAIFSGFADVHPNKADLLVGEEGVFERTPVTQFDATVIDATPLSLLPTRDMRLYAQRRYQLNLALKDLGRLPQLPYRKFVFAHIFAPHPPFVFGPHGEARQPENRIFDQADASDFMDKGGTKPEYAEGYIDQLQYINTGVLTAIDAIQKQSKTPPIIIVQGDHGPRMLEDWSSPDRTDLRETYGNLNAFYLPDGAASSVFYDTITPVNSFRLLLDHEFKADFPRLPDRNYFTTATRFYDYIDVTDRIPATLDESSNAPQTRPLTTAPKP